jgi:FkbM family methyltransferase
MRRIVHKVADLFGRDSRLIGGLRTAYESFEGAAYRRGVPFRINGVEFRRHPHCRDRFPKNFSYEVDVAAFLRSRVKPGQLCFDVGANVGYYVLQLAHWLHPHGRIVAFEPNPGPRAILKNLIALNDLDSRVAIVPAAIGSFPARDTLYIPQDGTRGLDGISRLGEPAKEFGSASSTVEVQVITLDDYCSVSCLIPDWILIDIEGFELDALLGAKRLISEYKERVGLVVEIHPDLWLGHSGRALAASLLEELNLRPVSLTGQKDPLGERGVVYLAPTY